jgi:hypothetical protein
MEALIEIIRKLLGAFFMKPRLRVLLYSRKEMLELRTRTVETCGGYAFA